MTAVLVVMLVSSIPRFQGTAEQLHTEQRAFELVQLLRYARERAIAQAIEMRWQWDDEERRVAVEMLGADARWTRIEERAAQSAPLPPQMEMRLSNPEGGPVDCDCVQFSPDGTATPTIMVLRRGGQALTVTVDGATGQPTLTAGTAAR